MASTFLYFSFLLAQQPVWFCWVQAPLQPLQDNLESATYETFEKDSTKYVVYQAAIHAALVDCSRQEGTEDIVVMVVGAGRGPLVTASLKASGDCIPQHCLMLSDMPPDLFCSNQENCAF